MNMTTLAAALPTTACASKGDYSAQRASNGQQFSQALDAVESSDVPPQSDSSPEASTNSSCHSADNSSTPAANNSSAPVSQASSSRPSTMQQSVAGTNKGIAPSNHNASTTAAKNTKKGDTGPGSIGTTNLISTTGTSENPSSESPYSLDDTVEANQTTVAQVFADLSKSDLSNSVVQSDNAAGIVSPLATGLILPNGQCVEGSKAAGAQPSASTSERTASMKNRVLSGELVNTTDEEMTTAASLAVQGGVSEQRQTGPTAIPSNGAQSRAMHHGLDRTQADGGSPVDVLPPVALSTNGAELPGRQVALPLATSAAGTLDGSDPIDTSLPTSNLSPNTLQASSPMLTGPNVLFTNDLTLAQTHVSGGDAPPPIQQVAAAVVTLTKSGDDVPQLTLHLQPTELGALQIRVEKAGPGLTHIEVTAARPETLTALQNSEAQLHQSLDLAGVPTAGRLVTFHLPDSQNTTLGAATALDAGGYGAGQSNPQSNGNGQTNQFAQSGRSQNNDSQDIIEPALAKAISAAQSYRIGLNITA